MASSSHSSFVTSLLVFASLLFNCCFCQDFSLQEYACAKKDVPLSDGIFTPIENDRLKIDPSHLTNDSSKAQADVLLMDTTDDQLIISVILSSGNEHCFFEHVRMPDTCTKTECEGTNCTINFICDSMMTSVIDLPKARYFRLTLWKEMSISITNQCTWIAFIDRAHLLVKKSEADSNLLVEQCWEKGGLGGALVVLIIFLLLGFGFIVAGVTAAFVLFRLWQRNRQQLKRSHRTSPEGEYDIAKMEDRSSSNLSTSAAEFGVEVPDSLYSDEEGEKKGEAGEKKEGEEGEKKEGEGKKKGEEGEKAQA